MSVKVNLKAIKEHKVGRYVCTRVNCIRCRLHNIRDVNSRVVTTYCGIKIKRGLNSHSFSLKKYVIRNTKVCNNCKRVNIE